ncbi:uncharacterized protein LOC127864733 isoform X2 [Dreissena polymorpha]|nr:uncharacterized protein LOC127864733 isoform X2 [Dreissena polymorpha]
MPTPTASTPTTKAELFSMMPADLARRQLREQSARLRPLRPNLAHAKFSPRKEMSDDVLVWEVEQMEAARKGTPVRSFRISCLSALFWIHVSRPLT